ncbi:NUDIX domain-containing protein [Vagococcus fluvialis]|uniref:NUDIX domain-containing protein n=1 Tax=Vagococcus fluvialis TaxID=2738 RepID=UPI003B59085A
MTDIRVTIDNYKFDVRACGILEDKGKILVSTEVDGTQTLSGGAVKLGETSEEAVVREFLEETNLHVKVDKLVAVVENLFEFENAPYQQVIFVYALSLNEKKQQELICKEKVNASWVNKNLVTMLKPERLNELVGLETESVLHMTNKD